MLLLTAKVQGVDQRRFADLGVAGVLFKPFDPLTLADADFRRAGLEGLASPGRCTHLMQEYERSGRQDGRAAGAVVAEEPPHRGGAAGDAGPGLCRGRIWKSERRSAREAAQAAHKLAGALGMYGYDEGTNIAREIDALLSSDVPGVAHLADLTARLRAAVFPAGA